MAEAAKPVRIPDSDHPISITSNPNRVIVTFGGEVVADTHAALTLKEADYPPVLYIPRTDVTMAHFARTDRATYCPYKGDCSYFTIAAGGKRAENAAWSYETPYPSVAGIAQHLAFYPDCIDAIEERANA